MITQSCAICIKKKSKNWCCPNYSNCPYIENNYNTIINNFKDYTEVIVYKHEFNISGNPNLTDVDRSRKFGYNEHGQLVPLTADASLSKLQQTLVDSRKRSLDNLFGYALSNEWKYFITLTFDPNEIADRTSRDCVNYAWKLFRQKMQYIFKDITIIVVTENHELGGIHFHGFLGNCDLSPYLEQGIDHMEYLYDYDYNKQEKIYKLDKHGNKIKNKHYLKPMTDTFIDWNGNKKELPIYIFKNNFFKYGFSTIVEIEKGSNSRQIANYLTKYFTKDQQSNIAYNKKSYYRTKNLKFKNKEVSKKSETEMLELVSGLPIKKETDKFIVYHYNNSDLPKLKGLIEDNITDSEKIFAKEITQTKLKDIF
ncbi:MAG: hypothetical protein IJZ29_02060 [Clostridia bacterium]|nr:hypothetical protein [Clostridia bacterium]